MEETGLNLLIKHKSKLIVPLCANGYYFQISEDKFRYDNFLEIVMSELKNREKNNSIGNNEKPSIEKWENYIENLSSELLSDHKQIFPTNDHQAIK